MIRKLLPVVLVLALGTIACGFNVNVPIHTITPGPLVTDPINVIGMLLAVLYAPQLGWNRAPAWSFYNIADFKPVVTVNGSNVRIEQGNWHLTGIPDLSNIKNNWDLSMGEQPLNLSIEAGAYHADYHFGGLALANLSVKDGASDAKMNFASPNLTEMSLLSYETGASNVLLTGLGYADFASLLFHSGAGNFTLDFTGGLKRDGSVDIETGVSNTTLVIPSGIPVQLTVDGGLSNVTSDSGWTRNTNLYTQTGSGPQLTIVVHMGAGNLTITK